MQINKTDRISQIFDTIIAQLGGLNDLLDAMLCTALEERFARRGPAYLSPLARRLRVIEPSPLADLLDDAVDQGRLTEAERDDVMLADVVLSGQRRADRAEV